MDTQRHAPAIAWRGGESPAHEATAYLKFERAGWLELVAVTSAKALMTEAPVGPVGPVAPSVPLDPALPVAPAGPVTPARRGGVGCAGGNAAD
jgi:hypothetical protein